MAQTPKKISWGQESDSGLLGRPGVVGDMGVILAALDGMSATIIRIDTRLQEHGERLAAACARLDGLATRTDLTDSIEHHRQNCAKSKDNFTTWAKGIGIILGAIGALIGAFAAAWAVSPH